MKKILVVGAGRGGAVVLKAMLGMEKMKVVAVIDKDPTSTGITIAKENGIKVSDDFLPFLTSDLDVIFEATGNSEVFEQLSRFKYPSTILIHGAIANLIMSLIEEKEALIKQLTRQQKELDTILNSTHDAMIAINREGRVTLFNKAAEKIITQYYG